MSFLRGKMDRSVVLNNRLKGTNRFGRALPLCNKLKDLSVICGKFSLTTYVELLLNCARLLFLNRIIHNIHYNVLPSSNYCDHTLPNSCFDHNRYLSKYCHSWPNSYYIHRRSIVTMVTVVSSVTTITVIPSVTTVTV